MSQEASARGKACRVALVAGVFLSAFLALAGPARAQYSVTPVIVQLGSGATPEARTLQLRNEGEKPLQIRLYTMDFEQSPDGKHTYLPLGEHPRSCRDRLRVVPDLVTVEPGDVQAVNVHMEPVGSGETCWSMVFAESPSRTRTGVHINLRIGVKVYGLAGAPSLEGEVVDASVGAVGAADDEEVRFAFSNHGSWPLRAEGEIEVRTFDGRLVDTLKVEAFSVLPGHTRHVHVSLGRDLASGRYLAIPILDFGGEYLAGSQVAFRIP
ncbi:MAG: hypothetical protein V3T24_01650 [Longimicrobiales bacterium]